MTCLRISFSRFGRTLYDVVCAEMFVYIKGFNIEHIRIITPQLHDELRKQTTIS